MRSSAASSSGAVFRNAFGLFFIAALVIAPFVALLWWWEPWSSPPPPPPKTPQQLAAGLRWKAILSAGEALRRAARDPTSVVFEDVKASDRGDVICLQYRAKNGFGGMTREVLVMTAKSTSQDVSAWKRSCVAGVSSDDAALFAMNNR